MKLVMEQCYWEDDGDSGKDFKECKKYQYHKW